MNTLNAIGFLCFGLGMGLAPVVAPDYFPASAIDGTSTRALWLQVMGIVQATLGGGYLIRRLAQTAEETLATTGRLLSRAFGLHAVRPLRYDDALDSAGSEQVALLAAGRGLQSDRVVTFGGEQTALGGPLEVALLDEKRFMHLLQRLRLLAHRHSDGAHADGAAAVVFGHHAEHALVHFIKTGRIDLEQLKRSGSHGLRNLSPRAFLSEVANEINQVVRDAGRSAGAGRDFV